MYEIDTAGHVAHRKSTLVKTLTRIDPGSGSSTTVEHVGNGPLGVAAGDGGV